MPVVLNKIKKWIGQLKVKLSEMTIAKCMSWKLLAALLFLQHSQFKFSEAATVKALQFGTTLNDYVKFYPNMRPLKYALTVCSWVKKQLAGNHRSWITYTTSLHGYEILISDNGGYNYIHDNSHSVSVNVPLNTWTHQCQSWSTSSRRKKVYYNGNLMGTFYVSNSDPLEEWGYILLGHDSGSRSDSEVFGGQLINLNIFGKELSASEVVEIYNRGRCSGVLEKHQRVNYITWENILSQPRTGRVFEVNAECTGKLYCHSVINTGRHVKMEDLSFS